MFVSTFAPSSPASAKVSMLPAEAIQIGGRVCTGRGSTETFTTSPFPLGSAISSPRHSFSTVSMWERITSRRRS
jgi:hypothetical protein